MASSPVEPAAVLDRVTVRYGARTAIADVDLTVERGTTTAIIGPNGSGKSTFLGVVAGLVRPTTGSVSVGSASVALVLQSTAIDPHLPITVIDAVRMGRYRERGLLGRIRGRDDAVIERAMARTRITDLANRQLQELSGGQRQRALVAQGLAQEADLLLLDEPATGLDLPSQEVILDLIDEERAAGRTVIMTTHSLEDAARCDTVVLLAGHVVAAGPPDEVLDDAHLAAAFRGSLVRLPSGAVLLDDPHHHAHDRPHHPHHGDH